MLAIDLTGKRALVTGAGQGVGRETALVLARAGATAVVNDVVGERADAVVAEIQALGLAAEACIFDVTSYSAITDALGEGRVDILVNNAGMAGVSGAFTTGAVADEDPAVWARFLGVNLDGVMLVTRAVLPGMIERGDGRIVTIISDAARVGEPKMAAYAAAKAGAAGFTRSVASEVGRYGITANCISLGTMRTPASGPSLEEEHPEAVKAMLRGYAIRRRGEPADVANLACFLASPLASWLTGQTIPLNGGYSMAL
jgi:3-oxoacyl-[acyl-carrier protein] reductase